MSDARKEAAKRVLVIDDDPLARDIVQVVLQDGGYEVETAPDGETGVEMFQDGKYDLVILDIFMPGLDGFETMDRMDPHSKGVPILTMSGRGLSTGAYPLHLAMTLGSDDTICKSFEHEELLEKVRLLTGGEASTGGFPVPAARPIAGILG